MAVGAVYLLRINPQDKVRLRQISIKNAALQRTAGQPRLLICGDSSVAFGMDPTVLREVTGLPTVNLGYDASCGVLALLGVGDRAARAGDTLVVEFIVDLLATPAEPVREGRLLAMLYGDPEIALGGTPALLPNGPVQAILTRMSIFSPTEHRMVNDAGRVMLRMPGFRYENCAIDDEGYFTSKVVLPFPSYEAFATVNPEWKPVFTEFVARMRRRGVTVYYALPWLECQTEKVETLRVGAETYLQSVEKMIPVLREPGYGLQSDVSLFADTAAHLSVEGAQRRSRSLGEVLKARAGLSKAQPGPMPESF